MIKRAALAGAAMLLSSAAGAQHVRYSGPYWYTPQPIAMCYSTPDGSYHATGSVFCTGTPFTSIRCMPNGTWVNTKEPICNGVPYGYMSW
ncbi:MAG: hypothetical protein JOZ16_07460 [Methylobacteriaceae bacterium]|nr:hypothetical protein [Methylobacteriaceae bacterium]